MCYTKGVLRVTMNKLNESVFQYLDSHTETGVEDDATDANKSALSDVDKIRKQLKKDFSAKKKEMSDFEKTTNRREQKPMKNSELKKLHLSEEMFVEGVGDFYYRPKREPLAGVIEAELTGGEKGYKKTATGWSPTVAPSLLLDQSTVGISYDGNFELYLDSEELAHKVIAVGEKYNRRTKYEKLNSPYSNKNHKVTIYLEEDDWDIPYYDPNVNIRNDRRGASLATV